MPSIPKISPTLALPFDKGDAAKRFLEKQLTVSRPGPGLGTRTNKFGLIETVPENELRLDYDPVTGECLGVLIEESRTNLLERSDPTHSGWSENIEGTGTIVEEGDYVKFTCSSVGDRAYRIMGTGYGVSITADSTYTVSVDIVYADKNFGSFAWIDFIGNSISLADFGIDISKPFPQRGSITFTAATSGVLDTLRLGIGVSSGTNYSNGVVKIRNIQIEAGSFPTSYIPTAGSKVTRLADDISIEGQDFLDFYNQSEGTFVVETDKDRGGQFDAVFTLNNGSDNVRYMLWSDYTNQEFDLYIRESGTIYLNESTTSYGNKIAVSYPNSKVYVEGVVYDFNSVTAPVQIDRLHIGSRFSGLPFNGHIKRLLYYPKALSDEVLQSLTRKSIFD